MIALALSISQHLYTKVDLPTTLMRYGIGLLWNCSRKVSLSQHFQRHYIKLTYNSIVEINISIQVACMPACASCFRHFAPKLQAFFATRILGTKTSNEYSMPSEPEITDNFGKLEWHQTSRDWKFRDSRGKNHGLPQTTSSLQTSAEGFPFGKITFVESISAQGTDRPMPQRPDRCFQGPQRLAQPEDRV